MLTLQERMDAALLRIKNGHAPMRIPADPTDPDWVLEDCAKKIERLTQQLADAKEIHDAQRVMCEHLEAEKQALQREITFEKEANKRLCDTAMLQLNECAELKAKVEAQAAELEEAAQHRAALAAQNIRYYHVVRYVFDNYELPNDVDDKLMAVTKQDEDALSSRTPKKE